ncbi:MAG: hypothetical protein HYR88_00825 [Verrucomicrobia bacterium]|nr:hypothetical protein [Verrucomicrobiota bacterium]MBI3870317.1 hypothetical protein [Verrucomicrobiota bacterium]
MNQTASYSLLQALRERRSRRFCLGMEMPAGPLAHKSRFKPRPLTEDEEALLAFAACGITGPALGDLSYAAGGGGNIMAGLCGRTVASGDAIQAVGLIITNDAGAWHLRRPQDFAARDVAELAQMSQRGEFTSLYQKSRVKLRDSRCAPPNRPVFNINANGWSAYAPGTTCFVPINDLTFLYINGVLEILNETTGAFILDERRSYRPAGLRDFARSRGGHLHDDPADGRTTTIQQVETMVAEFVAVEQGMVHQNLGLMAQAMGLGGFPFFASHDFAWTQALGFRQRPLRASRYLGAGPFVSMGMKLLGRDPEIPFAIGLEAGGETLLKAYSPPYFATMSHAVDAVVEAKLGKEGALKRPNANPSWKDQVAVTNAIAPLSPLAIAAAKAYFEYLWRHYGRFPVHIPPFKTIVAFQAGHLDLEFYEKHYQPSAVSQSHRDDFARVAAGLPTRPLA